ncbi:AcrR family transcriptional regulator [Nakamurella sp. UYEF19]|uniref:TetR/AcrR family transcriptional regulator n=1 Tax=Nakamurella sp. UYEF19 TaxID=1756392 RepID=UPI00339198D6
MRLVKSGDPDDLTTKARIRDTAITMIGRSGFAAATVRAIAAEVGVSPALLLHHFGSKDGLREACNEYVLGWYTVQVDEIARDDSPATVVGMIERTPEMLPLAAYIRRSLIDGGTFARQIFDALVVDTERYLDRSVASGRVRPTADPHGRAVLMVVTSLGSHLLAEYLVPTETPAEQLVPAASQRLMLPGLELYTHGLFTDSGYLDAYREWQRENPASQSSVRGERQEMREESS